jgi:hypothetical protein
MSHFHKSDDVLDEWLAVADKATPPAHAPRGSHSRAALRLAFAGAVAVIIVAAVLAPRALAPNTDIAGGTPSETAPTTASVSETASATATSAPTPTAGESTSSSASPTPGPITATTFTTPGITTDWHTFSWSAVAAGSPLPGIRVFSWQGGFVAYGALSSGQASDVWVSSDGLTWTPVLEEPSLLVAPGPDGLVVIASDASGSQTVWTSSDGRQWTDAGQPQGIGSVTSLGGTAAGFVAAASAPSGTGKFAASQYEVGYSADGVHWTPVDVEPNLVWDDYGPLVQAGNGRFFLMGGLPAGAASDQGAFRLLSSQQGTAVLWWSDDGRAWHRATGAIGYYGTGIDFGRDGMILHSDMRLIPGGTALSLSTDGGKTWQAESAFSPLGESVCGQGECSTGPDGEIGSNGTLFVAVKSDGRAWTSYDGKAWTSIVWSAPLGPFTVLPRGVVVNDQYGAAE